MRKRAFLLCLTCGLLLSDVYAQIRKEDSTAIARLQQKLTGDYYSKMKENAPLFNGAEYTGHGQGIIGHPFFDSPDAFKGWIEYDGILYQNVLIKYDLIDETVIINDFTNNYFIKLNSKKIRSFGFDNTEFIQPSLYNEPADGFYQLIYKGDASVLAKRRKQVEYNTNVEKTISTYVQYDKYFIKNEGRYISITSKKNILNALKDKRSQIRRFISENKLSFRKQPEEILVKTVAYYDQIKNTK